MKDNFLVGIDIGTKKICTLIGQIKADEEKEEVEIIGYGLAESRGLKKGAIVHMEKSVEDIKKSIREAELTAGVMIESAYVNISGKPYPEHQRQGQHQHHRSQQGDHQGRSGPGHHPRQRHPPAQRSNHPPCPPPRIHRRFPGQHQGPGGHGRRNSGRLPPHHHLLADLDQELAALPEKGQNQRAKDGAFPHRRRRGGAHPGREGTGGTAHRHRRRHHRYGRVR